MKKNQTPKLGVAFNEYNDRGVILQFCKTLPIHHKRETEVGPFYGVGYESGKYVWYNKEEITELLES